MTLTADTLASLNRSNQDAIEKTTPSNYVDDCGDNDSNVSSTGNMNMGDVGGTNNQTSVSPRHSGDFTGEPTDEHSRLPPSPAVRRLSLGSRGSGGASESGSGGAGSNYSSRKSKGTSMLRRLSGNNDTNGGNDTGKKQRRTSFAGSVDSSEAGSGSYTKTVSSRRGSEGGSEKRRSSVFGRKSETGSINNDNSNNFWSKMAMKENIWDDEDDDDDIDLDDFDAKSCCSSFGLICKHMWSSCMNGIKLSVLKTFETTKAHPHILLLTFMVFAILCATSVAVTVKFANDNEAKARDEAVDIAQETGYFFSKQLDGAIVPLFSMAQFVQQLDIFHDLPNEIGMANTTGALPFMPRSTADSAYTHRNISGVCDDPELQSRFNEIAADIKKNAGMERVLVNLQLAPMAVVCLLYPLINTEDFDEGIVMDNTGAVGHDLLNDPKRKFIAEATVPADGVVIAGPLTLRQCQDCDATVQTAFIARLPIDAPTDDQTPITVDGVDYNKWGFTVALINWGELIERSGVYEKFDDLGMRFRLTRTDTNFNETSQEYYDKVVVLAESHEGFDFSEDEITSIKLDTTNNEWQMEVAYEDGLEPSWKKGAIAGVVVLSFLISLMFLTILVEKQIHRDLLKELIPSVALRKLEKGQTVVDKYDIVTIFFSDIVGYTSMSAEMRPIQVMKLLNEFYIAVDDLADKHGVYKIETIGDAYMASGGVPFRCMGPLGAQKVALFALDVIKLVETFKTSDGLQIKVRAGLNSGPVVGGVIGRKKPQFTIFGDTVNLASRMESTSETMRIQCSDMTYRLLQDAPTHTFHFEDRGSVKIKGKGSMHSWFINGATEGIIRPEMQMLKKLDEEMEKEEHDSEEANTSNGTGSNSADVNQMSSTIEEGNGGGLRAACEKIQASHDYLENDVVNLDDTDHTDHLVNTEQKGDSEYDA